MTTTEGLNGCVVDRITAPKDGGALIPRICNYVTVYVKSVFVNMIKSKGAEIRTLSWIIWVIT